MNYLINVQRAVLFDKVVSLHRHISIVDCIIKAIGRLDTGETQNDESFELLLISKEISVYEYDASTTEVIGYNTEDGIGRILIYIDLKGDPWLVCHKENNGEFTSLFSRYSPLAIAFASA